MRSHVNSSEGKHGTRSPPCQGLDEAPPVTADCLSPAASDDGGSGSCSDTGCGSGGAGENGVQASAAGGAVFSTGRSSCSLAQAGPGAAGVSPSAAAALEALLAATPAGGAAAPASSSGGSNGNAGRLGKVCAWLCDGGV